MTRLSLRRTGGTIMAPVLWYGGRSSLGPPRPDRHLLLLLQTRQAQSADAQSLPQGQCPTLKGEQAPGQNFWWPGQGIGKEVNEQLQEVPLLLHRHRNFFFHCIAELAIKPCRSSRSKLRGEFGIPKHLQNRKQKHDKATNTPNPKHQHKTKRTRQVFGR